MTIEELHLTIQSLTMVLVIIDLAVIPSLIWHWNVRQLWRRRLKNMKWYRPELWPRW